MNSSLTKFVGETSRKHPPATSHGKDADMRWLNNISLTPKLLASLGLMVVLAAGLVLIAVTSLGQVYTTVTELSEAHERLAYSSQGTANLLSYARNVEFLPLELTPAARNAYESGAQDDKRQFLSRLDGLEKMVTTEDGRRNVAKLREALSRYGVEHGKVLERAQKNDLDGSAKTAVDASALIGGMRVELSALEARNTKIFATAAGHIAAVYQSSKWVLILVAAIGGAVGVGLAAALIVMGVARPLRNITVAMAQVAGGDAATVVPSIGQKDEVGQLAGALETFKLNLIESKRLAVLEETERTSKDRRANALDVLIKGFESAIGKIVQTVSSASTQLESAAGTLTKTAATTQQLSGVVASASEEASANVQAVASATEELSSSVSEIGRQVQESSNIASQAVKQAQQTDARINELSQAAGRIGDVVKLITAIAEQTNLLALNATIEAARAGEAGRGFAVVASEVKQLASQTAKATEEISAQIASMQTATEESVGAIKEIGGTIGRISEIAGAIAAAVEEQGAATQEISRNVGEAAKGTAEVAGNITAVNRGAGETGSASAQVLSSAQSLSAESGHLKAEVEKFLSTVRAA
jgi:methyl-accepting chemotaxis protein